MLRFAHQPYPPSYYAASRHPWVTQPSLQTQARYDVGVIGGGLSGLSVALHLQEQGMSVALLEGAQIGFGASGVNGGQVIAGLSCPLSKLNQLVGIHIAKLLWDMSVEGVKLIEQRIAQHHIECGWTQGHALAATKSSHVKQLKNMLQDSKRVGYTTLHEWDSVTLRQQLDSRHYHGALFDSTSGHLHPLNYTLGLAQAALNAGVHIYENTPAVRIEYSQSPKIITETGLINCNDIVLAGNIFNSKLAPELAKTITPVGTYMIATQPLGADRAHALIKNNMAICSTQHYSMHYFRLSSDHRLLFGGRASYTGRPPQHLTALLRGDMLKVFPQLSDVAIDYTWGGLCDITWNNAPDFGRLGQHVYYLQGFSGHGLNITQVAGKIMSEAILDTCSRLDAFSEIPHRRFPNNTYIRRALLTLGTLYYRLQDQF